MNRCCREIGKILIIIECQLIIGIAKTRPGQSAQYTRQKISRIRTVGWVSGRRNKPAVHIGILNPPCIRVTCLGRNGSSNGHGNGLGGAGTGTVNIAAHLTVLRDIDCNISDQIAVVSTAKQITTQRTVDQIDCNVARGGSCIVTATAIYIFNCFTVVDIQPDIAIQRTLRGSAINILDSGVAFTLGCSFISVNTERTITDTPG